MDISNKSNTNNQMSGGDFLTYTFILLFLVFAGYMIYDNISDRLIKNDRITGPDFTPEQYDSIQRHRFIQDSIAEIRRAERIAEREREVRIRREQDSLLMIEQKKRQAEIDENIRVYVKSIFKSYNELMSFKNNNSFHQFGFGLGGPYHQWLLNAQKLSNNPLHRELYDRYGFGVLSLEQLGQEYVKTRGMENDFTITLRGRFSRLAHETQY